MAVNNPSGLTINNPQTGIQYTKVTDSSADWSSVANSTYFYDIASALTYYKDSTGTIQNLFSATFSGVITTNLVYVSTTGNDSTGARNDLSKPFLTLEAALSASLSGDTIIVFSGSYTVTTTASNGLSKDGVNWYFYPNTTVTKSSSGHIFNVSGFTLGSNVYGYGNFVKTTSTGHVFFASGQYDAVCNFNVTFEFNYCTNSTTHCIQANVASGYGLRIKGLGYLSSSAGYAIATWVYTSALIDVPRIASTSNYAILMGGNVSNSSSFIINSAYVTSTTTYAVYASGGVYNIANCNGSSIGYFASYTTFGRTIINGMTNGIYCTNYSDVYLNGYATKIQMVHSLSRLYGGSCGDLTLSAGYVNTSVGSPVSYSVLTISGGEANIDVDQGGNLYKLVQTGGVLTLNGNINSGQFASTSTISGGRLNLRCNLTVSDCPEWIVMSNSGTTIDLGNSMIYMTGTNRGAGFDWGKNTFIRYQGGKIFSNGATFILTDTNCLPFCVEGANREIRVLSGGLNTNTLLSVLSAKKKKIKWNVSAVASISITLNDGSGGNEIFSETDTTTYNTTALLAQRMVALINASATLDITASQDTAGVNTYFYTEADVASVNFTFPASTNLTYSWVVENSYALTNVSGGMIIQNSDII